MKPSGTTTLFRMQQAAQAEVDRLELGPDEAYLVRKRDAFAGVVRLIDAILSSEALINSVRERMGARAVLATDIDAEVAD